VDFPGRIVDNAVRSWTFAALEQILRETSTSSLPFTKYVGGVDTASSSKMLPFGRNTKEQKIAVSEPKSMIHPTRSSSLSAGRSHSEDPPYARPPPSGQVVFENGQYQDRPAPNQDSSIPQAKTGSQELAAARAQLLVVQRRIFEYVGKSVGWSIGWTAVLATLEPKEDLTDVNLNEEEDSEEESAAPEQEAALTAPNFGLSAAALVSAISSIDQFRQFYEVGLLAPLHHVPANTFKRR
jgi:hypothetical protein